MENLDLLLPTPPGPTPVRRKGVVTSVSPVHVQLDGDTAPMSTSPDKICSVALGDRVYIEILGEQMIILGVFETADALVGDVPVGVSFEYGGAVAPPGYLMYSGGEAVSRTMYARLFGVLGTRWGAGDGSTTFNLPNHRGRVSVGISDTGTFNVVGKTGGAETHQLVVAEMPTHAHTTFNHTHTLAAHSHTYGSNISLAAGGGAHGTSVNNGSYTTSSGGGGLTGNNGAGDVSFSGGNGAHNNLQPFIVVQYIIRF